jgi:hypothetical protein
MRRTLRYIVRGLHFYETGAPRLPDQPIVIHEADADNPENLEEVTHLFSLMGPFEFKGMMGNGIFRYASITQEEHPEVTAFLMVFFGVVPIVGITGIAREEKKRAPTFEEMLLNKGSREGRLRRIVERGLVAPPPDDLLGFLQRVWDSKER